MGILRKFFVWIDHAAFGLIDDAYSIIFDFASINVSMEEFNEIKKNLYIIVGIFALFRIALFLVNALIDPDKLTEKGKGISNILVRTFIMLVLLVITPFLFNELFTIQNTVMKENIIPKLILNKEIYSSSGNNITVNQKNIGAEAGDQMQSIILSALVPISSEAFENKSKTSEIYYKVKENVTCEENCIDAVNEYSEKVAQNKLTVSTISEHITAQATVPGSNNKKDRVYVYDYMIIVTTAAGVFLTYMLFSYALDIAVRVFELVVLQVVSPLFIVTFIDPKSSSSGPFKKWLQAIGKSYATLFLRIAMVCLMVLLISWVNTSDVFASLFKGTSSFLAKAALVIGLLIFIKNLPKWLGGMLGIETSGFGGLNIAKKLGGAALVGGALEKGIGTAKSGAKKIAKKPIDRAVNNSKKRLQNVSDRGLGKLAARRQAAQMYKNGQTMTNADGVPISKKDAMRLAGQARSQQIKNEQMADPNNDFRMFKNIRDKATDARKSVDPNYQSKREIKFDQANAELDVRLRNAGMDAGSMGLKNKKAKDMATARAIYGDRLNRGNRLKADGGLNKDFAPINEEGINQAFYSTLGHTPQTVKEIAVADYAKNNGLNTTQINTLLSGGSIQDANGNFITSDSLVNGLGTYQKALYEMTAFKNSVSNQSEYVQAVNGITTANTALVELQEKRATLIAHGQSTADVDQLIQTRTAERQSYVDTIKDNYNVMMTNEFSGSNYRQDPTTGLRSFETSASVDKMDTVVNINGHLYNQFGEFTATNRKDAKGNTIYEFKEFTKEKMNQFSSAISESQSKKENGKLKNNIETAKPAELKAAEKKSE